MQTEVKCFIAVNEQGYEEGEALSADIGAEAIDRDYSDSGYTNVNSENPCNVNGRITSIEIWSVTNLTGCKVASFKIIGDGTLGKKYLSTRDYVSIGNVTAGSKQTFEVNLLVREGDLIGIYSETGSIEYGDTDGTHVYYLSGDFIPCENLLFSRDANAQVSVKGTGISVKPKTFATIDGSLLVDDNESGAFFGVRIPCTMTPFVLTITLGDGGTGYTVGDILTIVQAGGSDATVIVDSVDDDGVILSVTLLDEGEGYSIEDDLPVTGGTGSDATINITAVSSINRDTVDACVNTSQGIRVTITVNGEDVSDALVGSIQIMHNLNYISTFSFSLGDPKYSPKVDANIDIGNVVIITVYINGQEMRLFTGIIDGIPATNKEKYRLNIFGRDYGKKLKTTKTLISIQESAQRKYRGSMVKYLAGQVGITGVDIPLGDAVTIDHSFQDQEVWDMTQKECEIEGWFVRFDEYGVMYVKTKVLKTTPDWEYGENKFIEIGLNKEYDCIINKVIILGAIFEEETITQDETDQEVEPAEDPEDTYTDYSFSHSFAAGEVVEGWSEGDATIKVTASYIGYTKPLGYIFPTTQNYKFTISGSDSGKIKGLAFSITGGAIGSKGSNYVIVYRDCTGMLPSFSQAAFAITITFKVKDEGSAIEDLETENPEATFTSTITYTQVKANVSDPNSIGIYGERKPKNGISMDFPLAETVAQCKRIGENVIIDSHRFVEQPDIEVPFNPKLTVGQTIRLTDKKHGYDEDDYLVEEAIHYINFDNDGKIKARTRVGGVFYS